MQARLTDAPTDLPQLHVFSHFSCKRCDSLRSGAALLQWESLHSFKHL